jgi:triacylglycerol lipase
MIFQYMSTAAQRRMCPLIDKRPSSDCATPWTTWTQSIINGAVGDYLHTSDNGLGIAMALYVANKPLPLTRAALLQAHPRPTTKLCVLIHGLGCNEGSWAYRDPDDPERETSYGARLALDLGYTPLFVRYNTGLAIAKNGQHLAELLVALVAAYPLQVDELVLIGHSMGGLVIRHACHLGSRRHDQWVGHVRQVFYLGSPHDGAPLARLSHIAAQVLHTVPNPITRLIGNIFNLRSQGVKDLHDAAIVDTVNHPDALPRQAVPWLASAQHYLIFGTLTADPRHLVATLLGDGLVLVPALPETPQDDEVLHPILREHIACFAQTNHMQLAHDPVVYQQIRQWCAACERSA